MRRPIALLVFAISLTSGLTNNTGGQDAYRSPAELKKLSLDENGGSPIGGRSMATSRSCRTLFIPLRVALTSLTEPPKETTEIARSQFAQASLFLDNITFDSVLRRYVGDLPNPPTPSSSNCKVEATVVGRNLLDDKHPEFRDGPQVLPGRSNATSSEPQNGISKDNVNCLCEFDGRAASAVYSGTSSAKRRVCAKSGFSL